MRTIITITLLLLVVACGDPYKKGLEEGKVIGEAEGYEVGYDEGYTKGDSDGYGRAEEYFSTAGYNEGFVDGKVEGLSEGYNQGYTVGKNETYQGAYVIGYNVGYNDGFDDGETEGYVSGYYDGQDDGAFDAYSSGYDLGAIVGYADGFQDGYDLGYDEGFNSGYDLGYDDGFYDGSLSVGKSRQLKGFANILSLAHNDVFDYSKISPVKVTPRGIEANGRILFSDLSLTVKDTLKRAAVVEQYLVVEMAKQVEGKFGLSLDRSLKIAKAANHFRKFSSKRAITQDDSHAYAVEVIGTDFNEITNAYEQTLEGNVFAFESVLKRAAEKNETSPEKIASILSNYFI